MVDKYFEDHLESKDAGDINDEGDIAYLKVVLSNCLGDGHRPNQTS